jgi:hypothetical protein
VGLRKYLRDAFPGIEEDADLEQMAEQFVVELGWLQERSFPVEFSQIPRATLSAKELLGLAECFNRYRMECWIGGEGAGGGRWSLGSTQNTIGLGVKALTAPPR